MINIFSEVFWRRVLSFLKWFYLVLFCIDLLLVCSDFLRLFVQEFSSERVFALLEAVLLSGLSFTVYYSFMTAGAAYKFHFQTKNADFRRELNKLGYALCGVSFFDALSVFGKYLFRVDRSVSAGFVNSGTWGAELYNMYSSVKPLLFDFTKFFTPRPIGVAALLFGLFVFHLANLREKHCSSDATKR